MNQWTWNHVLAIMTIESTCLSGSFKVYIYMHSNPVIYFSVHCITNFHQNCAENGQCIFGSFIPIYYQLLFFSVKYFQDLRLGLYYSQLFAILLHEYAIWWNTMWHCENSELILNVHVETTWDFDPIPLSYWVIHVITGNCRWSQHYKT